MNCSPFLWMAQLGLFWTRKVSNWLSRLSPLLIVGTHRMLLSSSVLPECFVFLQTRQGGIAWMPSDKIRTLEKPIKTKQQQQQQNTVEIRNFQCSHSLETKPPWLNDCCQKPLRQCWITKKRKRPHVQMTRIIAFLNTGVVVKLTLLWTSWKTGCTYDRPPFWPRDAQDLVPCLIPS